MLGIAGYASVMFGRRRGTGLGWVGDKWPHLESITYSFPVLTLLAVDPNVEAGPRNGLETARRRFT